MTVTVGILHHHLSWLLHRWLWHILGWRVVWNCFSNGHPLVILFLANLVGNRLCNHGKRLITIGSSRSSSQVKSYLTILGVRVIIIMLWYDSYWPSVAIDWVVSCVVIQFNLTQANGRSHISVSFDILLILSSRRVLITCVNDVKGLWSSALATNLILLAPNFIHVLSWIILLLHKLPPLHITVKIFESTSLIVFILLFLFFGSDLSIIGSKVFVESFLLG